MKQCSKKELPEPLRARDGVGQNGCRRSGKRRGAARIHPLLVLAVGGAIGGGLLGSYVSGSYGSRRASPLSRTAGLWPGFPVGMAAGEANRAEQARREFARGLQALLESETSLMDGAASVNVRLEDGTEAGVDPDRAVDGASVIKLAVMGALYDAWTDGELKRSAVDERRLRLMITRSKNIVTNELIRELGKARINRWLEENGYEQTRVRTLILKDEPAGPNLVTAREMTRMMEQIARGELVSPQASGEMRRLLLAQRWKERIPAGLPDEAVVGNKTGTMHNLLHDVAFVEPPGGPRYYISVLVEREDRSRVRSEAIAELSRRVYDYVTLNWPTVVRARREASRSASTPRSAGEDSPGS